MEGYKKTDSAVEKQKDGNEEKKFELELAKLKLERFKAWLTAVSIVVPLLASMATFLLTSYNTTAQKRIELDNLERQYRESEIASRMELMKLLIEKSDRKEEVLKTWKQIFPADDWVDKISLDAK